MRDRVEIIEGSHGEAEVADRAFAGADAVFWLVPPNPHATDVETAYADSAGRPVRRSRAMASHGSSASPPSVAG